MSQKVHVDTAALHTAGQDLEEIMGNLANTCTVLAEELVDPIVKVSGSSKMVAYGEDLRQVAEDASKQAKASRATNEAIAEYVRKLNEIAEN